MTGNQIISEYAVRQYQGLGQTSREAKYHAASLATVNLGDQMPGVRYKHGIFPEEWIEWVDDNLLRGVSASSIVSILAAKGFHPYRNVRLMHRIISWNSLEIFSDEHPALDLSSSSPKIDESFISFVKTLAMRGIDGAVLLGNKETQFTQF